MKSSILLGALLCIVISCKESGITMHSDKDFMNVPGPIRFNAQSYTFKESAHPNENEYRQDYLLGLEEVSHYTDKLLLQLTLGDQDMKVLAVAKAKEINNLKPTDDIAAYNVGENKNTGEVLLDFISRVKDADGNTYAEWNIYRFKAYSDAKGRKGYTIFGWSRRAYKDAINDLARELQANRKGLVVPFMQLEYPAVKLD